IDDNEIIISDWPQSAGSTQDQICDGAAVYYAALGWTVYRTPAFDSGWTHFTYTNMVLCNGLVLLPKYSAISDTYDNQALATVQAAMPERQVVQITCDNLDLGMPPQPRGHGRGVSIRQKIDDSASLQVADQRPVALSLAPGPVVDADHTRSSRVGACLTHSPAQEGVLAHTEQHTAPERLRRTTAHRAAKICHEILESPRATAMASGEGRRRGLAEGLRRAARCHAAEPSN
ncbi:MAG: hypothetical protein COB65_10540, partial [Thalassobium sp.]